MPLQFGDETHWQLDVRVQAQGLGVGGFVIMGWQYLMPN